MLHCGIEILTTAEGKTDIFRTVGSLTRKAKNYTVRYRQDGDNVTLDFNSSVFHMERIGKTEISSVFRLGEHTVMCIGGFGAKGEISVFTSNYSLQPSDKGCLVTLHYDLIFSDSVQTFQLKLKIDTSEEK